MTTHRTDLQTQFQETTDGEATGMTRYRWRCSCGDFGKQWQTSTKESGSTAAAARRARNGGARHVAAMERGK